VEPEWETGLRRITLSGPGGVAILDTNSDRPAAIVRDRSSGQIRAILTDLPHGERTMAEVARLTDEPGFEVLFSRGIPDTAAWRR